MRSATRSVLLSYWLLSYGARWTLADPTFPYSAQVNAPNVYVRSGPGEEYYPTAKLPQGMTVEVFRHDPGGWFAVRPPEDSFSWVRADMVEPIDHRRAIVKHQRVAARVGSAFSDVRDVIQVQLESGEEVLVLEAQRFDTGQGTQVWYRIAPPAGEFRWIFGRFLDPAPGSQDRMVKRSPRDRPVEPVARDVRRRSDRDDLAARAPVSGATTAHYLPPKRGTQPEHLPAVEASDPDPAESEAVARDHEQNSDQWHGRPAAEQVAGYAPAPRRGGARDRNRMRPHVAQRDATTGEPLDGDAEDPTESDEWAEQEPATESEYPEESDAADAAADDHAAVDDREPARSVVEESDAPARRRRRSRVASAPIDTERSTRDAFEFDSLDDASAGADAGNLAELAPPPRSTRFEPLPNDLSETEFQAALDQLDLALAATVSQDTSAWELGSLTARADELLARAETALERGRVRLIAKKTARFSEIQRRSRNPGAGRSLAASPDTRATHSSERARGPNYDGAGKLMRVVAGRAGDPAFALVDRQGLVRYYVTPAPGINLRHYVGREVGLSGSLGYWPELNTQHVTAQRVTLLDSGLPLR